MGEILYICHFCGEPCGEYSCHNFGYYVHNDQSWVMQYKDGEEPEYIKMVESVQRYINDELNDNDNIRWCGCPV